MIAIDDETLEKYPDRVSDLKRRMKAIEGAVRKATNNTFQRREKRFTAMVTDGALPGAPSWFHKGDTVQVTDAGAWDGLYLVTIAAGGSLTLDEMPEDGTACTVTRIEYPADVEAGANDMLRWDMEFRPKAGIKTETVSRHSVTYQDAEAGNGNTGYPAALTGFLNPHRKARF